MGNLSTNFYANTQDAEGNQIELTGWNVEDMAAELAEYGDEGLSAKVVDEAGFVRGWIHGDGRWTAQ